ASWLASKGIKTEGMQVGGRRKFSFGRVKLTPAWHGAGIAENGAMNYGGVACGFVIEVEGKKIYHAGDTGLTMEMKLLEAEKIDAACLPIGGYYTMDAEDAVRAVSFIKPTNVIPMHYDTFPQIKADPNEFAKAAEAEVTSAKVRVLAVGAAIEL
ncbi:MAG: metal-dependent hydrolase, partial [Synergistes sp.]|nr:metal-dependent hydrolase [Synergistes sp.]